MKTITVRDKDNNAYTMTYTAESIKALEARGFNLDELTSKPMTMIPMLFEGGLLVNYGTSITPDKALEIYQAQRNKSGLITKMIELYNEPLDEVLATEGNAEWECNF